MCERFIKGMNATFTRVGAPELTEAQVAIIKDFTEFYERGFLKDIQTVQGALQILQVKLPSELSAEPMEIFKDIRNVFKVSEEGLPGIMRRTFETVFMGLGFKPLPTGAADSDGGMRAGPKTESNESEYSKFKSTFDKMFSESKSTGEAHAEIEVGGSSKAMSHALHALIHKIEDQNLEHLLIVGYSTKETLPGIARVESFSAEMGIHSGDRIKRGVLRLCAQERFDEWEKEAKAATTAKKGPQPSDVAPGSPASE